MDQLAVYGGFVDLNLQFQIGNFTNFGLKIRMLRHRNFTARRLLLHKIAGLFFNVNQAIGFQQFIAAFCCIQTDPLLRCKLAFFGAGKFDPKSSRWVRITLFQGAPLVSEIGQPFADDWNFAVMPTLPTAAGEH